MILNKVNICGVNFFNGQKADRIQDQLNEIKKYLFQIRIIILTLFRIIEIGKNYINMIFLLVVVI